MCDAAEDGDRDARRWLLTLAIHTGLVSTRRLLAPTALEGRMGPASCMTPIRWPYGAAARSPTHERYTAAVAVRALTEDRHGGDLDKT